MFEQQEVNKRLTVLISELKGLETNLKKAETGVAEAKLVIKCYNAEINFWQDKLDKILFNPN